MPSGFQFIYTHPRSGNEKVHHEPRAEMGPEGKEVRLHPIAPTVITAVLLIGALLAASVTLLSGTVADANRLMADNGIPYTSGRSGGGRGERRCAHGPGGRRWRRCGPSGGPRGD